MQYKSRQLSRICRKKIVKEKTFTSSQSFWNKLSRMTLLGLKTFVISYWKERLRDYDLFLRNSLIGWHFLQLWKILFIFYLKNFSEIIVYVLSNVNLIFSAKFTFQNYMQDIYFKPWTRIGPYIFGLVLGYIMFYRKNIKAGRYTVVSFNLNVLPYFHQWQI